MSEHYVSDEDVQAAKSELEQAIKKYQRAIRGDDAYVDGWAVISHILTVEGESDGTSMLGLSVPTGQSFVMTRGLLEAARDAERSRA